MSALLKYASLVSLAAAAMLAAGCSTRVEGAQNQPNGTSKSANGVLGNVVPPSGSPSAHSSLVGRCDGSTTDDLQMELFGNGVYALVESEHKSYTDNGKYTYDDTTMVFTKDASPVKAMTCSVDSTKDGSGATVSSLRCALDERGSSVAFFAHCPLATFPIKADPPAVTDTGGPIEQGSSHADAGASIPSITCPGTPGCPVEPSTYGTPGTESSAWEGRCTAGPRSGELASLLLTGSRYSGALSSKGMLGGTYYVNETGDAITGVADHLGMVEISCARINGSDGTKTLSCTFGQTMSFGTQCGTIVMKSSGS